MKLLIQRVKSASVSIGGNPVGTIGTGALVLLGIHREDSSDNIQPLVKRLINLRFFPDEQGKTNLSLLDTGGQLLIVSQFTLYADCTTGRRPSFTSAAAGDHARQLYEEFVAAVKREVEVVKTGQFGAQMEVFLINEGPFTLTLEDR